MVCHYFFFNAVVRGGRKGEEGGKKKKKKKITENYVPTIEDKEDYAKYLGINLHTERCFMWIAEEGIKARLPDGWRPCSTAEGQVYYYNTLTDKSSWIHPRDLEYKQILQKERLKKEEVGVPAPRVEPTSTSYQQSTSVSTPAVSPQRVTDNHVCTKISIRKYHNSETVLLNARVSSTTTFASVASLFPKTPPPFLDAEGFSFPPSDLVQSHFTTSTALVYLDGY